MPGWQQGVVAGCEQGITLRAHPTSEEELVGILLLDCLEAVAWEEGNSPMFGVSCNTKGLARTCSGLFNQVIMGLLAIYYWGGHQNGG